MNKRLPVILLLCLLTLPIFAQEESAVDSTLGWTYPSLINVTVSQVSFSNWAAGGENSYSINGLTVLGADRKGKKSIWENDLSLAYGVMKQGENELRKTDDNIELSSKYGYKASKDWYYSGLLQFKSQFAEGFKYDDDAGTKTKLSEFMSPAYLNLSIGMTYQPSKVFSLFIGPISGRSTFVMDDTLSAAGAFGVEPGENIRNEFGGTLKAELNKDIVKNVNMTTKLELFSNYAEKPGNVDWDWQFLLTMKVNKLLSANINLHLIYDDD
ncbi:MAG: DUF3078 domain-containing protein, partial [Chloroflexia bacterium]|nr:DUF3078 domain-containing protein [Chloroflexia bacterium]